MAIFILKQERWWRSRTDPRCNVGAGLVPTSRPGSSKSEVAYRGMLARFSVSMLEERGRLSLQCVLLGYFRIGDNPTRNSKDQRESELETRIGL